MVGNGHAMRVAGQVLEYVFRPAEWWLGVDHPILPEQLSQEAVKELGFAQMLEIPMEAELVLAEQALQPRDELATKDAAEHLHRKEEVVLGMNPARVVWRQAPGGYDTVHVGMSRPPPTIP